MEQGLRWVNFECRFSPLVGHYSTPIHTMRKTREILRLIWSCNQSRRDTARTCGVGKSTVDATIKRATAAGLSWPLPLALDDEALERCLYPSAINQVSRKLSQPDWQSLHDELAKHKKLTLMLLW